MEYKFINLKNEIEQRLKTRKDLMNRSFPTITPITFDTVQRQRTYTKEKQLSEFSEEFINEIVTIIENKAFSFATGSRGCYQGIETIGEDENGIFFINFKENNDFPIKPEDYELYNEYISKCNFYGMVGDLPKGNNIDLKEFMITINKQIKENEKFS